MNHSKNRRLKTAIYLVSVIVVILIIASPKLITSTQTKVDYNTFMSQVEEKKIEEVNIDESSDKITYKLDGKRCYTNYPDYENFKSELLKSGVDIKINETSILSEVFPYLSLVLYALIVFVLLRNINGGGHFSIENSASIKTRFSDVAGMEEIKEDLLLIADMMKNPAYAEKGARLPKGILLEGPPGNGKTFISRAFAGETGVNFIAVNASDFSSSLVGAGSSKIRRLFKKAKANKPCVIFIDEIDGVGSARSSDNSAAGREMNTIITALLNEMDGFDASSGIIVMAATNRADSLDEALIRPGRFDRQLVLSYPDKSTRLALFRLYSKDAELSDDVDLDKLANRTYGCSCSEIECIVNEARILSIKNGRDRLHTDDFENAIIQMTIKGSIRKDANQSEKTRIHTAFHEAGHAVTGHLLGDEEIAVISIKPTTSGAGGFTVSGMDDETDYSTAKNIRNKIMMLYGGRAAEYLHGGKNPDVISTGAADDVRKATRYAITLTELQTGIDYSLFADDGKAEVIKRCQSTLNNAWEDTVKLLETNWHYVEKTAELLIKKETLTKEEFRQVFE